MEKVLNPLSGYLALVFSLILLGVSVSLFIFGASNNSPASMVFAFISFIAFIFFLKGLMIIQPNHSRVLSFFGKYVGTVKANGLFFINPLYSTQWEILIKLLLMWNAIWNMSESKVRRPFVIWL